MHISKKILAVAALSGAVLGVHAEERLTLDGSTTVGPIAKAFAEYYMSTTPGVNVVVSESGSGNGAKGIRYRHDGPAMQDLARGTQFSAHLQRGPDQLFADDLHFEPQALSERHVVDQIHCHRVSPASLRVPGQGDRP